jgi:hypothetical protein
MTHEERALEAAWKICSAWDGKITKPVLRKAIEAYVKEAGVSPVAEPKDTWHEDDGPVTWWKFPVEEPSWIGTPKDDDWPGYHTHWTPHPEIPAQNADAVQELMP